jgi:hypothetical protein
MGQPMTNRERPIIFSAPMVRAILNGSKTQTRRICKPAATLSRVVACQDPATYAEGQRPPYITPGWFGDEDGDVQFFCPYGKPGDRLWVRETLDFDDARGHFYKATGMYVGPSLDYEREPSPQNGLPCRVVPAIHMPLWASRITLEVTEVRVEQLQGISHIDAMAEGCDTGSWTIAEGARPEAPFGSNAVKRFRLLWESINGRGSWDANPWVWVIEFRRLP